MLYAVCCVPVSPLRAESSHRSEMVSQLLMGEYGSVMEEKKDFIRIAHSYDGYEGWIQRSQVAIVDTLPADANGKVLVGDWVDKVAVNGSDAWIPMGAPLIGPAHQDIVIGPYKLRYHAASPWNAASASPSTEAITVRVMRYLNTPYLWGGRSVFGIDCSGFTQSIFRFFNKPLLRDAWQQATQGEVIGFLQEARCSDLAFFDNEEGRITHVGILLDEHRIIHASGKVRIDPIDNAGIVNSDTGERTHKLRVLKRYFE